MADQISSHFSCGGGSAEIPLRSNHLPHRANELAAPCLQWVQRPAAQAALAGPPRQVSRSGAPSLQAPHHLPASASSYHSTGPRRGRSSP